MNDWRRNLLKEMRLPVTGKNLKFLGTWQRWEGGHTHNDAKFNWLNTTQDAPGAVGSINSVGVKRFDSYRNGVRAQAATLMNGNYDDIVAALRSGDPYKARPVRGLSTWVGGPNAGINTKYVTNILGAGAVAAPKSAAPKLERRPVAQGKLPKGPNPNAAVHSYNDMINLLFGEDDPWFAKMMQQPDVANVPDIVVQRQKIVDPHGSVTHVPLPKGKVAGVIAAAAQQLGKPYVFGSGPDTASFDCSDLIQWAYSKIGIHLPRTTFDQIKMGRDVSGQALQPGDLIFPTGHHVVMYVGHGKVIAAPHTGTVVQYQPVPSSRVAVRRIV